MANVLQTFKDILSKAGLSESNEQVAKLLQSEQVKALEGVEIDPSINNLLAQKLITIEGAKAHGEVSAHFKKSYFGAIDTTLKTTLQELGIPDETIAEIEKNPTDKRVSEAMKKAIEIKGKNSSNQEIETLRNTLKAFQDNAKLEKEKLANDLQNTQKELKNVHRNYAIKSSLGDYKFIDTLKQEQIALLIQNEIETRLAQNKAALHFENGTFALKSAENPEMDYFDVSKGKTISYKEFLDEIVANSNLQKTADSGNPNNQGNQNQFQSGQSNFSKGQLGFLEKLKEKQSQS